MKTKTHLDNPSLMISSVASFVYVFGYRKNVFDFL